MLSHKKITAKYKISDIVRLTGAPTQMIQRWCDENIIHAAPRPKGSGRGVGRRFTRIEVLIAASIVPIGMLSVKASRIKVIAATIRAEFNRTVTKEAVWSSDITWYAAFLNTLGGEPAWLVVATPDHRVTRDPEIFVIYDIAESGSMLDFGADTPCGEPLQSFAIVNLINLGTVWKECIETFKIEDREVHE